MLIRINKFQVRLDEFLQVVDGLVPWKCVVVGFDKHLFLRGLSGSPAQLPQVSKLDCSFSYHVFVSRLTDGLDGKICQWDRFSELLIARLSRHSGCLKFYLESCLIPKCNAPCALSDELFSATAIVPDN